MGGLCGKVEDRSELRGCRRFSAELFGVRGNALLGVHDGGLLRALVVRTGGLDEPKPGCLPSRSWRYVTRRVPFIPLSTWPGIVQMYL